MQLLRSVSFVCFLMAAAAAPAMGQDTPSTADAGQSGYLIGGGGIARGPHTGPVFAVEVGEKIGRAFQAYLAFQHFDDLMTDSSRQDLEIAAAQLEALTLTPWEFRGRDRGRTFTGGVKVALPGRVRPYAAAGVGVLNLKRIVTERTLGDVSEAFRTLYAVDGSAADSSMRSTTRPLMEAGAGVGLVIGRAYIDVGYRYRRAFHAFDQTFDFTQLTTSAGIAF